MKKKTKRRSVYTAAIFRRQVLVYLGLTLMVLAVVVYFAFATTTIAVSTKPQTQTLTVSITIGPQPTDEKETKAVKNEITGTVLAQPVSATVTGTATPSSTSEEPAKATGTVTLVNHWSKSQPLQAGTRLLSEGGVLFRTTKRVDVPVGGTIDADVEADQPGKDGEIAPSHFEIVALWPGLKDKIYGESKQAFTGGTKSVVGVTQEDLVAARKAAVEKLEIDGTEQLSTTVADQPDVQSWNVLAVAAAAITDKPGAIVGDTTASFPYTVNTMLTAAIGNKVAFDALVEQKVSAQLGAGYRFLGFDKPPTLTIKESSAEQQTATISVRATIKAMIQANNPIFDAEHFINRSRSDVRSYFSQFQDIDSIDVRFSPFWTFRTPTLPDHIRVKLIETEAK